MLKILSTHTSKIIETSEQVELDNVFADISLIKHDGLIRSYISFFKKKLDIKKNNSTNVHLQTKDFDSVAVLGCNERPDNSVNIQLPIPKKTSISLIDEKFGLGKIDTDKTSTTPQKINNNPQKNYILNVELGKIVFDIQPGINESVFAEQKWQEHLIKYGFKVEIIK